MPTSSLASRSINQLRRLGAIVVLLGLVIAASPAAANAVVDGAHVVDVSVSIDDGAGHVAALPGAVVELYSGAGDQPFVSAVTGGDGGALLEFSGEAASTYVATATWPGAPGDLSSEVEGVEFAYDGTAASVGIVLHGTFGVIVGSVTAMEGDKPLADLSGGSVLVSAGDAVLQRLALDAAGSFRSGALPTGDAAQYRIAFVPPTGYRLGEPAGANTAFAMPRSAEGTAELQIARDFAVVREGDTGVPDPEPSPTAPAPSPGPTTAPVLPDGVVSLGATSELGRAIALSSDAEFDALLSRAREAGSDGSVIVVNDHGRVLGGLVAPTAVQVAPMKQIATTTVQSTGTVRVNDPEYVAFDLAAIMKANGVAVSPATSSQLEVDVDAVQTLFKRMVESQRDAARELRQSSPDIDRLGRTASEIEDAAATALRDATITSAISIAAGVQSPSTLGATVRIVGTMRSTPTALGTMRWEDEEVTGAFDLSDVQPGDHHLVLEMPELGATLVTAATVSVPTLPETGSEPVSAVVGGGLILLGAMAVAGAQVLRRRGNAAAVELIR